MIIRPCASQPGQPVAPLTDLCRLKSRTFPFFLRHQNGSTSLVREAKIKNIADRRSEVSCENAGACFNVCDI